MFVPQRLVLAYVFFCQEGILSVEMGIHVAPSVAGSLIEQGGAIVKRDSHLVAHKLTAALSTTCLQFSPAPLAPLNAPRMLGQAGLIAPAAAAACRARIVGRYRLSAVQERYVREPERS